MRAFIFLVGFLLASGGELVSIIFNLESHYYFKPLILPLLIGHYLFTVVDRNKILLASLFFCWIGDFVLMFSGDLYFISGLVSFLIGHVFYIFTFQQFINDTPEKLLTTQKVRYSFPIFLAGTGLIVVLYPTLGPLKIPVIIYATVLMIMVYNALMRTGRTNSSSFILVFMGALSFMASDSILAINKFYKPFELAHLYIMITYIGAQFLIVKGLILHNSAKTSA